MVVNRGRVVVCGLLESDLYYLSLKEFCLEPHNCIFGLSGRRNQVLGHQTGAAAQG